MTSTHRHQGLLTAAYEGSVSRRKDILPDGFRVSERKRFCDHLVDSGARSVLEIGCGAGHDSVFLQQRGFQVKAIDTTPGLVELARSQGVDAELFDVYDLGRRTETYDAVYTVNCLLHVPNSDIESVFASIADRLPAAGSMYLGLWGGHDIEGILETDSYEPKRFFSFRVAETLIGLLQKRFQLEYCQRFVTESGHVFNSLIVTKKERP